MDARTAAASLAAILGLVVTVLAVSDQWPFGNGVSAGERFPAASYIDDSGGRLGAADTIGVQGEPTQQQYVGDCNHSISACGDIIVEVPEGYFQRHPPPDVTAPTPEVKGWEKCDGISKIYPCVGDRREQAQNDLAAYLAVDSSEIHMINIELTEWPDTCLGVRRSDVACAEVITPGFRLVFEAEGRRYAYHTDFGSQVVGVE